MIKVVTSLFPSVIVLSLLACSPGSNVSLPCPIEVNSLDLAPRVVLIDPSGKVDSRIQRVENQYFEGERNVSLHATAMAELVLVCVPKTEIIAFAPGANEIQYGKDIVPAIRQAIKLDADVILMGFGTPINSEQLRLAIVAAENAGIIVVSPAGNTRAPSNLLSESENTPQFYWNEPIYPAAYETVIAVGALDSDQISSAEYSQNQPYVDVFAPGTLVTLSSKIYTNITLKGTSYAAAQVAAVVALASELYPSITPSSMRQAISSTGISIPGEGHIWGTAGVIHSQSLLAYFANQMEGSVQ